jgi:hypothetical protein
MSQPGLEEVLAPGFLGDLQSRPIEEIRVLRDRCQQVEVGHSFLRRLAQARLDIVAAHARRRSEVGERPGVTDLVEHLPDILSDHLRSAGPGRLPTYLAPSDEEEEALTAEVDAVCDAETLASLPRLSDAEVSTLIHRLTEVEREISSSRRAVHDRIDALQAELTRRYKSGEASVESLLR